VLGIITLLVIAAVVCIGTSMPVISAIPGVGSALQSFFALFFTIDNGTYYNQGATPFTDGRFGLVGSFYGATVPPLGLILVVLMIIGPLLGWRDSNPRHLLRALLWPAVVAVAVACAKIVLVKLNGETVDLIGLGYVALGAFAVGTNLVMILRTVRSGVLRIGGYLAHVGLALLLTGAVASTLYGAPEQKLVIPQDDQLSAYGYNFVFNGWRTTPEGKGLLDITVSKGKQAFQAAPLLYFNQRMGATMATPSIKSELFQDLYISPVEYQPAVDHNTAEFGTSDTHDIGPYKLTFLGFDASQVHQASSADVGAQVKVVYQGRELTLLPKLRINASETDPARAIQSMPVDLPDGHQLALDTFDPLQRKVILRIMGLSLPVDPAKAVVNVSVKPGISLVWAGVLVGVLGGLLALIRRAIEGRARLSGRRIRLPRGLGGLVRGGGD
jgi:cytochrome c-type biogenesis protein CcmF